MGDRGWGMGDRGWGIGDARRLGPSPTEIRSSPTEIGPSPTEIPRDRTFPTGMGMGGALTPDPCIPRVIPKRAAMRSTTLASLGLLASAVFAWHPGTAAAAAGGAGPERPRRHRRVGARQARRACPGPPGRRLRGHGGRPATARGVGDVRRAPRGRDAERRGRLPAQRPSVSHADLRPRLPGPPQPVPHRRASPRTRPVRRVDGWSSLLPTKAAFPLMDCAPRQSRLQRCSAGSDRPI